MKKYIKLLRIKQYVKNGFLFLPIFFSARLFNLNIFIEVLIGAIIFSIASSSIYILNDIKDINEDKIHPQKSKRPIASGLISIKNAKIISLILFLSAIFGAFILNQDFGIIIIAYLLLNLLYSFKLKHIAIVDISIIAIGFVLRVLAGAQLANVIASQYLILMTYLISLFIALAKRYDDILLKEHGQCTRKNIDGYNKDFVLTSMSIIAAVNIVTYILYTLSEDITTQFNSSYVYLTSFFVITGILRYLQITFVNQESVSPTNILFKDKFIIFTILLWLISFGIIIYI